MITAVSGRGPRLALIILLAAMPCVAIATLANPILQAGMIDPFIYTGLLHRYLQTLYRYGATYYANRVAFTVPARGVISLLGDAAGHYVIEATLLFAATVSTFVVGRRYYSRSVGVALAAWTSFNPWLIRSLTWDYPEGAAVCFMLVGLCCFSIIGRRAVLLHVAGGIAIAFACNCDPFVAAMAIAFAPAWLILCWPEGLRRCFVCAVAALVAFGGGYAILVVVQYLEMPGLGFGRELITFSEGMSLLQGAGAVWYSPLAPVLAEGRIYILAPPLLAVAAIMYLAGERLARRSEADRFASAATIFLVLACVVYWLFHDYFRSAVVTVFWYDGYAFAAAMFAMVALIGCSVRDLPRFTQRAGCWLTGVCFAVLWVCYPIWSPLLRAVTTTDFLIVAAIVTIAMLASWLPRIRALAALTGACLAIVVFYFPGDRIPEIDATPERAKLATTGSPYAALHDVSRTALERDVYQGGVFLQNLVAQTVPLSDTPVGFWYGEQPADILLGSIQSIFLYAYSRVVSPVLPSTPGETLDRRLRHELAAYPHIAILSRSLAVGDTAFQALNADGDTASLRGRYVFRGQAFRFVVTMTDYVPAPVPVGPLVTDIPGSRLAAENGGSLTTEGEVTTLRTTPQRWAYNAIVPLPADTFPKRKLVLRVRLQVLEGRIGVLVSPAISSAEVVEGTAAPTAAPTDIDIPIDDPAAARLLIFRNVSPSRASTVRIFDVAVHQATP